MAQCCLTSVLCCELIDPTWQGSHRLLHLTCLTEFKWGCYCRQRAGSNSFSVYTPNGEQRNKFETARNRKFLIHWNSKQGHLHEGEEHQEPQARICFFSLAQLKPTWRKVCWSKANLPISWYLCFFDVLDSLKPLVSLSRLESWSQVVKVRLLNWAVVSSDLDLCWMQETFPDKRGGAINYPITHPRLNKGNFYYANLTKNWKLSPCRHFHHRILDIQESKAAKLWSSSGLFLRPHFATISFHFKKRAAAYDYLKCRIRVKGCST